MHFQSLPVGRSDAVQAGYKEPPRRRVYIVLFFTYTSDRLVGWRPNRPNEGLIGGQLTNAGSALTFANRFLGAFLPGCQGLRLCLSDDTSELRASREEKRLRAEKWLGVLNQLLRHGSHKIMHSLT